MIVVEGKKQPDFKIGLLVSVSCTESKPYPYRIQQLHFELAETLAELKELQLRNNPQS